MPRGKKAQSTKRAPEEEPEKSTNENSNTQEQNDEETLKKRKTLHAPTVHAIVTDSLTHLSLQHWASADKSKSFDLSVVDSIYTKELLGHNFDIQRIMLLEVSHYLENYLWKHYDPKTATHAHMMSILVMVNEKFRENVSAWDAFHTKEEVFPTFFEKVLDMFYSKTMTLQEKTIYLVFLINLYQSLEDPMVRKECLSLVSLPLWTNLNEQRLAKELKSAPKINKLWDNFKSKDKDSKDKKKTFEKKFIVDLIQDFVSILDSISDPAPSDKVKYCERFVEFLLDLISQLPTRRLFHPVFQSQLLVQRCIKSHLSTLKEGKLFNHLVEMLKFYDGFEINNYTGSPISEEESMEIQSGKVHTLQKIAFQNFQELKDLALSNSATVESRDKLVKYLSGLTDARLYDLGHKLGLLGDKDTYPRDLVLETILSYHERRLSHIESINETSIFPTEDLLWDPDLIPTDEYNGDHCLALPKLNLQFLTFHDYLLRNYDLFRLEACYEIKLDLEDAIKRVNARKDAYSNKIKYVGWSRMALPVQEFSVKNVGKPKLGEEKPSEVNAEVKISLEKVRNQNTRDEWDSIKVHDVLFLVTLRPKLSEKQEIDTSLPFLDQYGVEFVRGCEVKELLDEKGKPIRDYESEESPRNGDVRTIKISLDPSQYHFDMTSKDEDVYGSFNLLIRRKAKENNFKAVLETIRDLMNTKTSVPEWLHDLFLGYGDPSSLKKIEKPLTVNFNDTFLSADHVTASFPGKKIIYKSLEGKEVDKKALLPPFRVTFPPTSSEDPLIVQSYTIPRPGPFPFNQPKKNQVEFTPSQVEGIRSGIKEGLTLIVGPPGTGKTDTAVQIINNWYHNYPEQRTLIVTHSNQALNQLFEKIVKLDIDERHFVRLGHGEEQLSVEKDFSKYGRVNYMLGRRIELLAQVEILTRSVNERPDFAYTCETSAQFYQSIVIPAINTFLAKVNESQTAEKVVEAFPYHKFFSHVPQPLFPPSNTYLQNMEIAETCLRFIHNLFKELDECRPFELLRSPYDRANYLVTHHAKIIAMTCTHAALKRAELVAQGFHYDNMLMEESAQVLEIETFIPMLLQENPKRLKRVVLIGDHNQLPPVVKNLSFQKYAHLDQSLFTRFVRLGMPYVELDAQGRARPQIAELYNWRYKKLSDLPVVKSEEYQLANAGLRHDFQMINVEDFDGHGETQPIPYFYQNLGEAEHCVALYMYMRLLGYPKEKITILTTYNGQKALIKDVIDARCGQNPLFGKPKITTVDRFQGQQNDYILLSLVRTSAVGHLRDVRRLVVAMSRARLGLYVFCRAKLFENCYELTQSFSKLRTRPTVLQIVENEEYPTKRKVNAEVKAVDITSLEQLGNLMTKVAPRAQERYEKDQAEKARILAEKQQEEMKKREEEMRKYNERMAAYNKQVAASQKQQRKPKQKAEEEEEVESEEEEDEPNSKMQE